MDKNTVVGLVQAFKINSSIQLNGMNHRVQEYKPPTTKDIPIDWRIHLLPDAPNPVGIRGSKGQCSL